MIVAVLSHYWFGKSVPSFDKEYLKRILGSLSYPTKMKLRYFKKFLEGTIDLRGISVKVPKEIFYEERNQEKQKREKTSKDLQRV